MSYEIHITRGREFESAGAHPISMRQWQSLLAAFRGLAPTANDSLQAILDNGDAHLAYADGIVLVLRYRDHALDRIKRVAARLGGNIIGEDGQHLGLEAHEEVHRVLDESGSTVDGGVLTPAQCEQLITLGDPMFSEAVRRDALSALGRLSQGQQVAGLAYLAVRAVECGGVPEETLTDAAAIFYSADPGQIARLRAEPTETWAAEVERRAGRLRTARQGHASEAAGSVVAVCAQCGAKNRVPTQRVADPKRCGRCKTRLG